MAWLEENLIQKNGALSELMEGYVNTTLSTCESNQVLYTTRHGLLKSPEDRRLHSAMGLMRHQDMVKDTVKMVFGGRERKLQESRE